MNVSINVNNKAQYCSIEVLNRALLKIRKIQACRADNLES